MPSVPSSLPTWWLRVWIVIGLGAFALITIVPLLIFQTYTTEYERFHACERKERTECRPSLIWFFAGWVRPPAITPTSTSTPSHR